MKSFTNERFRRAFRKLPPPIRTQAREAYRMFKADPWHPGLNFKKVSATQPLYSARVTLDYRVIGIRDNDTIIWIWIGSHTEYERILASMK